MMRFLLFGMLALLTACASPPQEPAASWTDATGVFRNETLDIRCSAVAVAPTIVVTAAHCVGSSRADVLTFRARPAHVIATGGYHSTGKNLSLATGKTDWALVQVEQVPYWLAITTDLGHRAIPSMAGGYGRSVDQISLTLCAALFASNPEVVILGCEVVHGDSGGPVIVFTPEPKLLGIVVGTRPGSTMMVPSGNFAAHIP